MMSFSEAEIKLLDGTSRKVVLSVLKAMWEANIECDQMINSSHLSNMILIECEKHQDDEDWTADVIGDRLIGILLQLISFLQSRRCAHFMLDNVDMIKGETPERMDELAKSVWSLVRSLILGNNKINTLR